MQLRPYQQDAIERIYSYFEEHDGNPVIVIPTAGGKSVVQAALIRRVLEQFPGQRFLLLTHVRELLEQNAEKLRALWPEAPVGIYSAGLKRRESGRQITIAGIQSCYRRAALFGSIDLIIIDECHRVPKRGEGMYRRFLKDLRAINPKLKVIGMSATPYRMGSGYLHKGENRIFTDIAYEAKIPELIKDGYLCPLVSKAGQTKVDLRNVHTRHGEFVQSELEAAMNKTQLINGAVDEMLKLCGEPNTDRQKWLVFCAGLSHAGNVCDQLNVRGIPAACVTGKTPGDERTQILDDFQRGRYRALTNVNVLTTGYDAPGIDAVIMLRPTQSAGLYYQMVGRGMRLHPVKDNALVLDFAGNIMRHGPVDKIKARDPGEAGQAPLKECPSCQLLVAIAATQCPECGHTFPVAPKTSATGHDTRASDLPILSTGENSIHRIEVDRVSYPVHRKPGKPPSLRVNYHCGLATYSEWVCVEHQGYARRKAEQWWRRRLPKDLLGGQLETRGIKMAPPNGSGCPDSVEAALKQAEFLEVPKEIVVDISGKYANIIAHKNLAPAKALELRMFL